MHVFIELVVWVMRHRTSFLGGKPFSATSLSYPVKRKLSIGLVLEFSSINGEMSRPFEYSFTKLGKRTLKNSGAGNLFHHDNVLLLLKSYEYERDFLKFIIISVEKN